MSILIGIFTFTLVLISAFLILIVLMQKSKDGGMGAALGGGVTESTFGAETGNVLTRATIKAAIAFFVICFGLYLGHIYMRKQAAATGEVLPSLSAAPAPAATPAAPSAPTPAPAPATP